MNDTLKAALVAAGMKRDRGEVLLKRVVPGTKTAYFFMLDEHEGMTAGKIEVNYRECHAHNGDLYTIVRNIHNPSPAELDLLEFIFSKTVAFSWLR